MAVGGGTCLQFGLVPIEYRAARCETRERALHPMSELPLCFLPHPVLRQPAQPVTAFNQELRRLIEEMIATMYAHDGIGLAAPQVRRDVQVFVASPAQHRGRELVLVNPTLEQATGLASVVEGCLSLPDVW